MKLFAQCQTPVASCFSSAAAKCVVTCNNSVQSVALLATCVPLLVSPLPLWGTTLLMNFVYNMPSVRGPQNNSAKLTSACLLSAPVCSYCPCSLPSRRQRWSPVQLKHTSSQHCQCVFFLETFDWSHASLQKRCCRWAPIVLLRDLMLLSCSVEWKQFREE